jgi:hypothetical protein
MLNIDHFTTVLKKTLFFAMTATLTTLEGEFAFQGFFY